MSSGLTELKDRLNELGVSYEDLRPFFLDGTDYSLEIQKDQLGVYLAEQKCFVSVDFHSKQLSFRSHSHLFAELLIKAVLGRQKKPLRVLDATAGFGKDSYIMALAGCEVKAYEAHKLMFTLLKDGISRLSDENIVSRIHITNADSKTAILETDCDVVYLDPMYPESKKSAKTNKEMSFLQHFIGHQTESAEELLELALQSDASKVVLKRPLKAPFCLNRKPSSQIKGKSVRFDIYAI